MSYQNCFYPMDMTQIPARFIPFIAAISGGSDIYFRQPVVDEVALVDEVVVVDKKMIVHMTDVDYLYQQRYFPQAVLHFLRLDQEQNF